MCKSARPNLQDPAGAVEEPQGVAPPTTGDTQEASVGGSDLQEEEALLEREPDAEPPPDGVENEDADEPASDQESRLPQTANAHPGPSAGTGALPLWLAPALGPVGSRHALARPDAHTPYKLPNRLELELTELCE